MKNDPCIQDLLVDVPPDGKLQDLGQTALLTIPGMMIQIIILPHESPPILGQLVELGEDQVRQYLVGIGIGQSKANKMIRAAKAEQGKFNIIIDQVELGRCKGKRYTYEAPAKTVYHYCLKLDDSHLNVIATQFGAANSTLLDSVVATFRFRQ